MTHANPQINIRLPPKLQSATEQYVDNYGYRNIQEFILEAIRDKIFRDNRYDETLSGKEIDLIEKLLSVSVEKGKIRDHDDITKGTLMQSQTDGVIPNTTLIFAQLF